MIDLPTSNVVVCEQNRTRADLYALWLDEYDVQTALTKREVEEVVDETIAVVVLDQSFGDGAAEEALEYFRSYAPQCRVVSTRERSSAFPRLGLDHNLVRPVFEADLVDIVETLVYRANYQLLLEHYYRTTVALSSYEWQGDEEATGAERYDRLRSRANYIQSLLSKLRPEMSDDDVRAVVSDITVEDIPGLEGTESVDSKYRPDGCSRCGSDWSGSDDQSVTQLGAYVWRCTDCGHVQMHTSASHRHIGSYRR